MSKDTHRRKAIELDKGDALLTEPWPHRVVRRLAEQKAVWHFKQFFALRQLALEQGTLSTAVRCQENLRALDEKWAEENPLPRRINGTTAHPGLQEMLPEREAAVNAEPKLLLEAVLKRSRMATAKADDEDDDS